MKIAFWAQQNVIMQNILFYMSGWRVLRFICNCKVNTAV